MQASCVRDRTRRWSAALRGTAELARIAEMRWAAGRTAVPLRLTNRFYKPLSLRCPSMHKISTVRNLWG
jgi:hypothetical protein